ncbi:MAG: hypothetical protein AAB610_03125 [Patescibacteria group bacterium]
MSTHLISYDLRVPETSEDYKKLINAIKALGGWATPLKSVWFVTTTKSASDVCDYIKAQTDLNDGILVVNITDDDWATVGVTKEVTDWMKVNI